MLYIIYEYSSWWKYILDGIKDYNINLVCISPKKLGFLMKVVRRILRHIGYYPLCMYYDIEYPVRAFPNSSLLYLNMGNIPIPLVKKISKYWNKVEKQSIWLSNPCSKAFYVSDNNIILNCLNNLKTNDIDVYTFDEHDARNYDLHLLNQVYRFDDGVSNDSVKFDFYFLGAVKDRLKEIKLIEQTLNKLHYSTFFILCENSSQYIDYSENISNIHNCICIVDIMQKNQSGMTLRPLEAISLKKKLLTDNKEIQYSDFYRKNNIFILGVDDLDSLDTFLKSPFVEIDYDIVKKYDVNYWLNNFR